MHVGSIMARGVLSCRTDDPMSHAARIMWENDCGAVPVVDDTGKVVGMITDRDLCMAAFTRDQPLSRMSVASACSDLLVAVRAGDSIEAAERMMQKHQVRRLPVTDDDGRPVGMLSLNDLARHARPGRGGDELDPRTILSTLAAIGTPREGRAPRPSQ